jgi:hypothetical protein
MVRIVSTTNSYSLAYRLYTYYITRTRFPFAFISAIVEDVRSKGRSLTPTLIATRRRELDTRVKERKFKASRL